MKKILVLFVILLISLHSYAKDAATSASKAPGDESLNSVSRPDGKVDPVLFANMDKHAGESLTFMGEIKHVWEYKPNKEYLYVFASTFGDTFVDFKNNKHKRLDHDIGDSTDCTILVKKSQFNRKYLEKIIFERKVYLFTGKVKMMDSTDEKDGSRKRPFLIVDKIQKD